MGGRPVDLAHSSDVFAERVALDLVVSLGLLGAGAARPECSWPGRFQTRLCPVSPGPSPPRCRGHVATHRLQGWYRQLAGPCPGSLSTSVALAQLPPWGAVLGATSRCVDRRPTCVPYACHTRARRATCVPGVPHACPMRATRVPGMPHACPMRATRVPGVGQRAGVGVTHVLPPDPEAAGPPHGSAWTLLPVLTPTYACTTGVQPRPGPWSQGLPEPHTALLLPPPLPSPPHASAASVYGRARTLCPSLVTPAGLQRVFVRGGVPLVPSRHWE